MRAVWWVGGFILVGAVLWALWPSAGAASDRTSKACLTNLKGIAAAMEIYSADTGRLPPADVWSTALVPYARSKDAFRCPSVKEYGYAWNKDLGPVEKSKIASPEKAPIAFDSADLRENANGSPTDLPSPGRHGGKNEMLFADGHASAAP